MPFTSAGPQADSELKPLTGFRVLVPRGGPWGDAVSASLRAQGAVPVVAPLINFAPTNEPEILADALEKLAAGEFDWVTVTSATTVDVLFAHRAIIPPTTKIAAVGETTAAALESMGYRVDLVPESDNNAAGLGNELLAREPEPKKFLALRSELAKPILSVMLADAGHEVDSVVAYRTVGVPVTDRIIRDVNNGRINVVLVTSGSVAEQVRTQFPDIPDDTFLAAIGPRTAEDAAKVGLPIHTIANEQSAEALVRAVRDYVLDEHDHG